MTPQEDVLLLASARISLLEQMVKLLFRERAFKNKHDLAYIMKYGEEIKQFFEGQMKDPEAEAIMIGVVDRFFTNLAAEVARDQENQGG
jgi:hypothetical protein